MVITRPGADYVAPGKKIDTERERERSKIYVRIDAVGRLSASAKPPFHDPWPIMQLAKIYILPCTLLCIRKSYCPQLPKLISCACPFLLMYQSHMTKMSQKDTGNLWRMSCDLSCQKYRTLKVEFCHFEMWVVGTAVRGEVTGWG
jgi:hypothetical protein